MKKKSREELHNKTIKELVVELAKHKSAVSKRRLEIRTGKSKNTALCRLADDCAVINTILKQKEYKEKKV